jgi:hypothetical protein
MVTTVKTIDTRIMNRLKELNLSEKKAVLSLVDNLVKSHDDEWSEELKAELDELKRLTKRENSNPTP